MMAHEYYMQQALALAEKGLYTTSPNPRVGCVIVKDGKVIGQGWHQKAGEPHAEVFALREAGTQTQGATAYVTLEPCSHQGKTPPCAQALIKAGVSQVVGAMQDPNPLVAGKGFQMLRDAGIRVIDSCLEKEANSLNKGFIKRMKTGVPYVRAKLAMSLDGRTAMASGESQWITGAAARKDVQSLRAQSCAIITGAQSTLLDNPSMTVRPEEAELDIPEHLQRQPLRVVVDGQERVPETAKLFSLTGNILIAGKQVRHKAIQRDSDLGRLDYWHQAKSNHVDLTALLAHLASLQINEVLVESGAELTGAFCQAGLIDELVIYCAPTLLGSSARPLLSLPLERMAQQIRWQWQDIQLVGQDIRLTLTPATAAHSMQHGTSEKVTSKGITQAFLKEHGFWK